MVLALCDLALGGIPKVKAPCSLLFISQMKASDSSLSLPVLPVLPQTELLI